MIYHSGLRIGLHTSKSGSLERAALKAHEVGANCFQIFSSSPRMWRASKPDPADIKVFRAAREKYDLAPLVIHDSYLINLVFPRICNSERLPWRRSAARSSAQSRSAPSIL